MVDDTNDTPDPTDEPSDSQLTPNQALRMYLDTREQEVSEQTLQAHRYRLQHFVEWCNENDIDDMNELDGRLLHQFRLWRKDDGDLNKVSLHTQLSTLRVFLKFLEKIDAVEDGLFDKLLIPSLDNGEDRRENILDPERAEQILEHYETYQYASLDHTLFLLLWRTGMRIGAAHSLDVSDFDRDETRLCLRHRPQGGTSLKMGEDGDRYIALQPETARILADWIDNRRPQVEDDYGREPFLTTGNGRPSKSTLRRHVYKVTQPCHRLQECPHDQSMESCAWKGTTDNAGCPSSVPPHDIRRGAITHFLREDVPQQVVSDRMNVEQDALEKHYDQRTEETKAEQRRQFLDDV